MDRGIALPFRDLGARRGVWSESRRGRFTPVQKPVPIVHEFGQTSGPFWTCAKNLAALRFDPRTVQLVASPFNDWAIPVFIINVAL
jgi:hypothetical protein